MSLAEELDIEPHSINLSLGVFGRTEKLPPEEVLEFITMCGHGMISRNLVTKLIKEVRDGKKSKEQAAKIMASPCVCGIFNTNRAIKLLSKYC
ncbi:MAG: hypothetical protein ACOWWH_04650 [Eubacteriaceae bacterium]